ncbi:MAG: hypothetical protein RLZ47_711 [Bacteroidota bacterium]
MKKYLVVIEGKPQGPFSIEELKLINIEPGTFVKTPELDDYKEAHELTELRELFGFKKELIQPQYYASLDVRLVAWLIDYLLIWAIYVGLSLFIIYFLIDDRKLKIIISFASIVLIPIFRSIYVTVMEASSQQASLGKRLLGLKVCDEMGKRLSLSKSILRNLCKWISALTLGIGYLMGFFDRKQQCLHDKMAGTLVVKERLL